ncbi:MAG: precorrin-3B synthase [Pseudaminobacter sp.]|nr:precorrin-3B synthase [Pseudaminobacter sp.]
MTGFSRRGACPALSAPMQTGDGLLVRLNPVAGGVSPNALIGLCESASHYGNGIMEVTARGSLQIRGLTAESASLLAAEVDALGIAVRTGVPVETGPLAGLDPEEIADPRPLAERIRQAIEAAGLEGKLGPKVSVVVDGGGRLSMDTVLADVRLVAVRRGDSTTWNLAIAGDAHAAMALSCLDEAAACDAALTILAAIAEHGKEVRARDLKPEQLAELASKFGTQNSFAPPSVLPIISPSRGEIIASSTPHTSGDAGDWYRRRRELISPLAGEMSGRTEGGGVGHTPLRATPLKIFNLMNGNALGIGLPFGSMPAEGLAALAKAAASLGASEIRFAQQRALLVLGLSKTACAELQSVAASLGFVTDPADPRTKIAACPGAPACASGHIATRKIAEEIASEFKDFDPPFSLHISGCAKGCANPAEAAFTLVGGEKGAGLVVSGTAKGLPGAYTPGYEAARGFGRVAALLRDRRRPGEDAAACLARLGTAKVTAVFQQG